MKRTLVSLLLTVVLLSGCSGAKPSSSSSHDMGTMAPAVAAPTYQNVTIASQDVNANTAQPQTFSVTIANGTKDVEVSASMTAGSFVALHVAIDGCGTASFGLGIANVASNFGPASACPMPTAGDKQVTVSVDEGAIVGSVQIMASVPSGSAAGPSS
jgi:hypothetical protein